MSHTEEIRISIFLPANEETINEWQQREAAAATATTTEPTALCRQTIEWP